MKAQVKKKVTIKILTGIIFIAIITGIIIFQKRMIYETYYYQDNRPASQEPPGGLAPSQVPQFVVLGFDDNYNQKGMQWVNSFMSGKKILSVQEMRPHMMGSPFTFLFIL